MSLDVVELLSDLVRIPSVNPMGQPVQGEEYFEYAMTDHLEKLFGAWAGPVSGNRSSRCDATSSPGWMGDRDRSPAAHSSSSKPIKILFRSTG